MPAPKVTGADEDEEEQTDDEETEEEVEEATEDEVEDEVEDVDDEEEVETEEVELPDDDEDDEESKGSLMSGTTFGISNKALLGIGIAAVVLLFVLRSGERQSSQRQYDDAEQVEEEVDAATEEGANTEVTEAGMSQMQYDPQTETDAIDSVFGGEE